METLPAFQPQMRSSFVTVFAWIFIFITGFATFISVLQNVMVTFFFPIDEMQSSMHSANGHENLPAFAQFMSAHMRLFFAAFFVLSVAMFVSSIALLKRKNWARIAFVVFLGLGIAWNIGGLFLQNSLISSMPQVPSNAPPEFQAHFESMATVVLVASSLFAIAFSALFAWLIKRLISKTIRAEFLPNGF